MELYLLLKSIKNMLEKEYFDEHYTDRQIPEDHDFMYEFNQDIQNGKLSGLYYCVVEQMEKIHDDPLGIHKLAEIGCAVIWNLEKDTDFIPLFSKANLEKVLEQYREAVIKCTESQSGKD